MDNYFALSTSPSKNMQVNRPTATGGSSARARRLKSNEIKAELVTNDPHSITVRKGYYFPVVKYWNSGNALVYRKRRIPRTATKFVYTSHTSVHNLSLQTPARPELLLAITLRKYAAT